MTYNGSFRNEGTPRWMVKEDPKTNSGFFGNGLDTSKWLQRGAVEEMSSSSPKKNGDIIRCG